ncbi:WD repeat, SAM and U-box domain-containing protein 1-like [Amphiura filiformis]|uniref:WD repeat, SAM and U-box domain-containing protein 1-like n=1 Tax=Amphiura filiformis TaxID=82378 RepID=UPI003B20CEC1
MSGLALVKVVKAHSSDTNCCAFSTSLLASCSGDKTVRLFNLDDFKELSFSPLLGHTYYVHWCCFSPFGTMLASCSTDGKIILWNTRNGETVAVLEHPSKGIIRICAFSPDSSLLLSGGTDNCLCLWDVNTKTLIRQFEGHQNTVAACTFTPDNNYVISGSSDGDLRIWDANYGQNKCLYLDSECNDLGVSALVISPTYGSANPNYIPDAISHKRHFLLATCGADNLVKVWDLNVFPEVNTRLRCKMTGHTAKVMSVAFSIDGSLLASGAGDSLVIVWNPILGQMLYTLEGHKRYVTCVAFSLDGRYLASGSNDKTVRIWQLDDTGIPCQQPAASRESSATAVIKPSAPAAETTTPKECHIQLLSDWSIDEVCKWLENIDLKQYCDVFKENHIDGKELQALDSKHLTSDLGIKPLGHRQKILRGVQMIREQGFYTATGQPTDDTVPDEYLCPITREIMRDPVIAADGYSYERSSIESWLRGGTNTSPMTNAPLTSNHLTPNRSLKMIIQRLYNL